MKTIPTDKQGAPSAEYLVEPNINAGADSAHESESAVWSKQKIEEMLAREDFAYQNIALPHGLETGGYDRSPTAALIFPADMTGKSVLDLGCSTGYFCFEAIKRGASRVMGIDMDPDSVRRARLLASCLGQPIEFECRDIEQEPVTEHFDYVLCLNLLHHLRNPLSGLDNMVSISRERLILEVATLGRHDRRKVNISRIARYFIAKMPVMFVTRAGTRGKREIQKFYMTPTALENLLVFQRGDIARLDTQPSQHKDRFVSIAHKHRIGHLLVVSGPTSAGKKTVMRKLLGNELPQLAERLGTPDGAVWGNPFNANRMWQPCEPVQERMLLHDDFLRPYLRSTRTHERDEVFDILDNAEKVTFVTIWTPPERLIRQITAAEIDGRKKKAAKRHLKIREEYKEPARVIQHYREWFAFTQAKTGDHIVVTLSEELVLRSVDEWESQVAARIAEQI